ncbi:MAG: outer membrane lipoprotein-sorting protein [Verrucomicrobiota bacterium]|jgi:hypothetical protein
MRLRIVAAIALAAAGANGWAAREAPPVGDPAAGAALAQQLRSAAPEENTETHGTLIIRSGKQTRQVPVVCRVVVKEGVWETDYETAAGTNGAGPERLVIIHSTNGPNQYLYARAAGAESGAGPLKPVAPAEAGIALAGSDFTLADLGLEFLHWPEQWRYRDETRLDRSCYVLESRNPQGGGITRVKSYFDKESGGPLMADGYDAEGHWVKEYSLHGSSFKKVNGHWRLEKMEIRNRKTRSQTELRFAIEP